MGLPRVDIELNGADIGLNRVGIELNKASIGLNGAGIGPTLEREGSLRRSPK